MNDNNAARLEELAYEEAVLRYIALQRELELAAVFDHFADVTQADRRPTPQLDFAIREAARRCERRERRAAWKVTWRRVLTAATLIITILLACSGAAFAFSADFREAFYQFVTDWQDGHVKITTERNDANAAVVESDVNAYAPAWPPEGFTLADEEHSPTLNMLY